MRYVTYYERPGIWGGSGQEEYCVPLLHFLYQFPELEITGHSPYVAPFGIFPPMHILNQVLAQTMPESVLHHWPLGECRDIYWRPFAVSANDYAELERDIANVPVVYEFQFGKVKTFWHFVRDTCLDEITEVAKWRDAVRERNGARFMKEAVARRELAKQMLAPSNELAMCFSPKTAVL